MNTANTFCSTLVDRIVPGRIRDPQELAALEEANGYHDTVLDVGEVFGVWSSRAPQVWRTSCRSRRPAST